MSNAVYKGTVKSDKGFYIGDVCYALSDDIYDNVWGEKHNYNEGLIEVPERGCGFAVGSTYNGDGKYRGSNSFRYPVDAGVIGIVPLELVEQDTSGVGTKHRGAGVAQYYFNDGYFEFTLPNGKTITIETE